MIFMMTMPFLFYAACVVVICAPVVGTFFINKVTTPLRLLIVLLWVWCFAGVAENYTGMHHIKNLWISQIINVVELFLFTWIYWHWRLSKRNGFILWGAFILYAMFWIVAKMTFEPITVFDDVTSGILKLYQICFSCIVIVTVFKEDSKIPLWREPKFLVTVAFLLYASSTFFLFSLATPLLQFSEENFRSLYNINWSMIISSDLIFLYALFCDSKIQKIAISA